MAYITPRVQITQEFISSPVFSQTPLPAFIVGAQYDTYRYGVAAEKPLTSAVNPDGTSGNVYNPNADVAYPYPNQVAGTTVDTDYVKVFVENVKAQYLPNTNLGSNAGNDAVELVLTPANNGTHYSNRVRFTNGSGTVAATNGYANRSNYFSNRDVQVGDLVDITDNLNNTLSTSIKALYADTVLQNGALAATVGTPVESHSDGVTNGTSTFTSASGAFTSALVGYHLTINTKGTFLILAVNSATSLTISGTPAAGSTLAYHIGGVFNDVANVAPQATVITNVPAYAWTGIGSDPTAADISLSTSDTTAYVGYPIQRIFNDTYVVTVTTSGSLATARFSVASTQGAFATQTGLALASNLLTLDDNAGNVVIWDFTGSTGSPVFVAGQQWSVALKATVALVNPTAGGSYSGASNITYKISATRGGAFYSGTNAATCALFTITSSNTDSSPQVLPQSGVAFSVGTLGVTASFSSAEENSEFITGDSWYIEAHAASTGAIKIIELNDNLPANTIASASTIAAVLSEKIASVEVPEIANATYDTLNWVATTSTLTLNEGLTVTDANLVSGITPVALSVLSGNVYIQHRDLVATNTVAIGSVTNPASITTLLGTITPDNPLAQGVSEAVTNANGTPVYFIGVQSDDVEGYNTALAIAAGSSSVYSVVPMTFDAAVQDAVIAHVDAMSTPQVGQWRIAWLATELEPTALVYNLKPDSSNWTGTVTADPLAVGTQYTLVTVAGATFLTDGVRPTDQVLINFRLAADGSTIYDTYTVAAVRSQTTLVLTTALTAAINVATKIQIQRAFTKSEQAANFAAVSAGFDNRRVRNVFSNGIATTDYFVAAALAGERSGVAPHQPLTYSEVLIADILTNSPQILNSTDLDTLAGSGTWIVTQTVVGATPYTRQQLTTDVSSIDYQEDSVGTNVDALSYAYAAALRPYIGKYNRNTNAIQLMNDALNATILYYQTQAVTATAGAQLLPDSKVLSIAPDPSFKDRVAIAIQNDVPGPINFANVLLSIPA
jgi:hypothetical protein